VNDAETVVCDPPNTTGGGAGSVTLMMTRLTIVAPGVPLITPVAGSNDRPDGKTPDVTAHVYTPLPPPDACIVNEYGTPTEPPGKLVVVICSACFEMLKTSCAMVDCFGVLESVTWNPNNSGSRKPSGWFAGFAVPLITPSGLRVNPPGSRPTGRFHV